MKKQNNLWGRILKNNLGIIIGLVGLVIGLAGIGLSYYSHIHSKVEREPCLVTTKNFPIFASPKGLVSSNFAFITKSNNKEITKNVYVQENSFWNKGSLAIKNENILDKLHLVYNKNDVEIIEVFVLEVSRPNIIKAFVKRISPNVINFGFNILEKNDGFKIQIIYISNKKQQVGLTGSIEGVERFRTVSDLTDENLYYGIWKVCMGLFPGFIIVLVAVCSIFLCRYFLRKFYPNDKVDLISLYLMLLLLLICCIMFIGVLIFIIIKGSNHFALQEGKESIPKMINIRPNK